MFYLAGNDFPQSAQELSASLRDSLREHFSLPSDESRAVCVEGKNYPEVNRVRIDLSGATVDARQLPPKPVGVGQRRPGLQALKLEIIGHPIRVKEAEVHLDLTAADVQCDYDRDQEGRPLLLLAAAKDGKVEVEISHDDLERLLLTQANAAAARQGIAVEKVALDLIPVDRRSVAMTARVTAKKLLARATVEVKGQLKVDDALNARLSALSCEGAGIVGGLAANLIRPYLERFNDTGLPLMAFSLGNVHLNDLRLSVGGSLKVTAAFGS